MRSISKELYLYIFFIFLYDKESPPEFLQSASIVAKLQFKDETRTGYHLGEAAISVHHVFVFFFNISVLCLLLL